MESTNQNNPRSTIFYTRRSTMGQEIGNEKRSRRSSLHRFLLKKTAQVEKTPVIERVPPRPKKRKGRSCSLHHGQGSKWMRNKSLRASPSTAVSFIIKKKLMLTPKERVIHKIKTDRHYAPIARNKIALNKLADCLSDVDSLKQTYLSPDWAITLALSKSIEEMEKEAKEKKKKKKKKKKLQNPVMRLSASESDVGDIEKMLFDKPTDVGLKDLENQK